MVTPRCPHCNAQGIDKIAAKRLGGFSLIYCGQCGAIYGVVQNPPKKTETKPDLVTPKEHRAGKTVTKDVGVPAKIIPRAKPKNDTPTPQSLDELGALMQHHYFDTARHGTNFMRIYLPPEDDDEETNDDS